MGKVAAHRHRRLYRVTGQDLTRPTRGAPIPIPLPFPRFFPGLQKAAGAKERVERRDKDGGRGENAEDDSR